MSGFFFGFWWLIFPIMGFCFGAFGMWMNYRAHRDRMDLLRTYAAQGRDPAEVARILQADAAMNGPPPWGGPGAWGGPGPWAGGWGWGHARWGRFGPYWEWRRVIVFTCLAAGFGFAAYYSDWPGGQAFVVVAVIMGILAVGSLIMAVLGTLMTPPLPPPPRDR